VKLNIKIGFLYIKRRVFLAILLNETIVVTTYTIDIVKESHYKKILAGYVHVMAKVSMMEGIEAVYNKA